MNSYYRISLNGKPAVWVGFVSPITNEQVFSLAVECKEMTASQIEIAQVETIDEETWKARR